MALGINRHDNYIIHDKVSINEWREYYKSVHDDYRVLKNVYPFSVLSIYPSVDPQLAVIRVVAVNKTFIERHGACKSDFITDYSKELYISIPLNYKNTGCDVYGGGWIIPDAFKDSDLHFYQNDLVSFGCFKGYRFCVGTPESFKDMKNVVLECVRTAEYMLIAYERFMRGDSTELNLISYSHGDVGRKEYNLNKKKYIP